MQSSMWILLQIIILMTLFAAVYVSIHSLLRFMLPERRTLPLQRIREMMTQQRRYRLYRSMFLVPRRESSLDELRGLLESCGLTIRAVDYTAGKRLVGFVSVLLSCGLYIAWEQQLVHSMLLLVVTVICGIAFVLVAGDKLILRAVYEQRRARIVQDVQTISSQLLYYKQSRLNIHGQLQRCVPLAIYIRKEMQLLVNEWYEGSSEAIQRFRKRLATDEADDFAETLNALRMYGSEQYYDLLEERIRSYKEKLALIRDSRKEAASYALFLLSGIPIMYTFLIFIYPWVAESRSLFDSLG